MDNSLPPQEQTTQATIPTTPIQMPITKTHLGWGFVLLYSLFVAITVFALQFLTAIFSGVMVNFSSQGDNPILQTFGGLNFWLDPMLGMLSFLGYLYLFVVTFFILRFLRVGMIILIASVVGILLVVTPSFKIMLAFGGLVVPVLILNNLIPPLFLLFYKWRAKEFNSHSFIKYLFIVIITILVINVGASMFQLAQTTAAVENANGLFPQ